MTAIDTLALAVALGCDAFAVGLAVGTTHHRPRQVFRLAFHFGLFQFLMPPAGWAAGQAVAGLARRWAPWLAFAVLAALGLNMVREGLSPAEDRPRSHDPTRGWSLVALSVATSIDALGAGFSLGLRGGSIWLAAGVIGVVAALMTLAAMRLGRRLGARFGRRMETAGGIILLALALRAVLA